MQSRKSFLLAASVCLLVGSVPELVAAQTAPATPVTPAAPTAPVAPEPATPTPPAVETQGIPVTRATVMVAAPSAASPPVSATKSPETIQVLVNDAVNQANKSWAQVYSLDNSRGMLSDKRVSVDQKNAKIKDVLKDTLDQAKIDYALDVAADVPADVRVSVKLDNVKIGTALDAITDSAGLKWQVSPSLSAMGGIVVSVGKNIPDAVRSTRILSELPAVGDLLTTKRGAPNIIYDYKQMPERIIATPRLQAAPGPFKAAAPSGKVDPYYNIVTQYAASTVARSSETRSTFTCPNCHNQVTIIRKNVEVDCPTCHRPFEAGWKVCPFDGTKRPVAKDDWRFCPICGKAIPDGVASLFTAPTPEAEMPNWLPFQPGQATPNWYAYQPQIGTAPLTIPPSVLPKAELPIIHPPAGNYR